LNSCALTPYVVAGGLGRIDFLEVEVSWRPHPSGFSSNCLPSPTGVSSASWDMEFVASDGDGNVRKVDVQ